ncbi:hypothetical protein FPRO03_11904 [Fusarium proliferatum]|nr:hypothetical protein FPRO03_11904 [Fusarium proliferatum]
MEEPRIISGFKRVAWPELRRLPLTIVTHLLPAGIEQVRRDIEREADRIMEKHGLHFQDEEDHCDPEMEMVCSFSEAEIHVEIVAPELVHRTHYTKIDDPVLQSAWECLSGTIFHRLQSFRATQGHITCLTLQKYGTNDYAGANPPTVYISVDYDSDETQWPEVITEVKRTVDATGWDDVQVHIEHNEGMIGHFDNFTNPTREQMNLGYGLKKRIEDDYYSTVHIWDDFGGARDVKRTDGEQLSPTNGTIGCFVQLRTSEPEPTWRTFILTSYQSVRPAFDGFTVTPDGTDSSVAPPIANSDLWTVDSAGYTPDSSAKPTTFESPSRSKHKFNTRCIDQSIALEKLYAASGFRRRVVGRRIDSALIEVDRPWHDRLPECDEWESPHSLLLKTPLVTYGMQLQEQTRSIEALSGYGWSSYRADVYKIGTGSGPTVGSFLCTNNLVMIRDDQYMNPSPTEEIAFAPERHNYDTSQWGFCAPGDSGSVVFDEDGGIVGLVIGGHKNNNSDNYGYGYVTPIEYVFKDIKDLLKEHVLDIRIAEP